MGAGGMRPRLPVFLRSRRTAVTVIPARHPGPDTVEPAAGRLRPTIMNRRAGRPCARIAVLVLAAAAVAACASAPPPVIPPEFRAACGHPGARVEVRKVPVTISHAACDLTGVAISYRDYGGATVPRGDGGTTIYNSGGFRLTVQSGSLDVTITATGTPGNA
jgi:hypothetical protein